MSTWSEERRANRAAAAEQARLDAAAAAELRIQERAARVQLAQAATDAERARTTAERDARRARRAAVVKLAGLWLGEHRVRVLIYLLAVASAVMAVPSMGVYGTAVYGGVTGAVLPVLSELGMWAFALAVEVTRRQYPGRPVWALQAGVWVFAGIGFGLNVLHGLQRGWTAGVVMGIVSVAGVIAHQLAVAAPRRSAAERTNAAIERAAHRKTTRIRKAAVRHAVAAIDAAGTVTLVYTPGRYVIGKRGRLVEAVPADAPDGPAIDPARHVGDVLAEEIGVYFTGLDVAARIEQDRPHAAGPVATLDPPADPAPEQQESTPKTVRKSTRKPATIREPKRRTIADLRADFAAALADPAIELDPTSAESIRKALRCAPKTARQLRDDHKNGK